jgi:hypothetical protein
MTPYYRADVRSRNPGDPATRTLDPQDGTEIAARHAEFCVYRATLDEPIEADPDAV